MPCFTCASSTYLATASRLTLHLALFLNQVGLALGYLQALVLEIGLQIAAPSAPCLSLHSSSGILLPTFLEMGCITFIFFNRYISVLCPMSYVYKKATVNVF